MYDHWLLRALALLIKIISMRYILILIFLFPFNSNAQNIKYAFQSVKDKDQMVFVRSTDSSRVILYVSEKCRSCLASLKRIKDEIVERKISIVVSTNNINFLRNLIKTNVPEMSGFIYYDPGRRLERDLGLKNIRFSYIIFSEGVFKKYDGSASMVTPPSQLNKKTIL